MKKAAALLLTIVAVCTACSLSSTAGSDDVMIRDDVRSNLLADGFEGISVAVDDGVVTLTGAVSTATYRQKAGSDAERVDGVKRVINRIDVRR